MIRCSYVCACMEASERENKRELATCGRGCDTVGEPGAKKYLEHIKVWGTEIPRALKNLGHRSTKGTWEPKAQKYPRHIRTRRTEVPGACLRLKGRPCVPVKFEHRVLHTYASDSSVHQAHVHRVLLCPRRLYVPENTGTNESVWGTEVSGAHAPGGQICWRNMCALGDRSGKHKYLKHVYMGHDRTAARMAPQYRRAS